MDTTHGPSQRSPRSGKISPGRSLYTDDYYDDQELYFDEFDDTESRIWDLEDMHVAHPEGQSLIGDPSDQGPHYGKGPKGYTRSDRLIYEDVCEVLKNDRQVDARTIEVVVDKGTVFLRGAIPNRKMKREAEKCVENIPWVNDVVNELAIKP